jgi:hypothetical protein
MGSTSQLVGFLGVPGINPNRQEGFLLVLARGGLQGPGFGTVYWGPWKLCADQGLWLQHQPVGRGSRRANPGQNRESDP